jgi:hypothetical protein
MARLGPDPRLLTAAVSPRLGVPEASLTSPSSWICRRLAGPFGSERGNTSAFEELRNDKDQGLDRYRMVRDEGGAHDASGRESLESPAEWVPPTMTCSGSCVLSVNR